MTFEKRRIAEVQRICFKHGYADSDDWTVPYTCFDAGFTAGKMWRKKRKILKKLPKDMYSNESVKKILETSEELRTLTKEFFSGKEV